MVVGRVNVISIWLNRGMARSIVFPGTLAQGNREHCHYKNEHLLYTLADVFAHSASDLS
jgi:hypothetical protein